MLRDSVTTHRANMSNTRQGLNAPWQTGKMRVSGKKFTTATYLGFTVLQILLCTCKAEAGEILIPPQTQYILLNEEEMATFFCQASGVSVFWSINNLTIFPQGNQTLEKEGWIFEETIVYLENRENVHNLTLKIPSDISYNNTNIKCAGAIHGVAFSAPAFLIIRDIYLSIEVDNFYAPPLLYVPSNERTTFYCEAVGESTFWGINHSTVDDGGDDYLKKKGFTFTTQKTARHHNITLGVPTLTEYNNTIITCRISNPHRRRGFVQSNAVKIIFMGAPSVPIPIPRFEGPGILILEWDAPFSWPDYPILHYDVNATNHSELVRETINETSVRFTTSEDHRECETIEFNVRASNILDDSEYGSVTTGFPIEPELMDDSIHVTKIESSDDGTPQVFMEIKLPRVCSFQSTNYTVTMTEADSKQATSLTRGPFNGTVERDSIVFSESIKAGKMYAVTVEFFTDVNQQSLNYVGKNIYIDPEVIPSELHQLGSSNQHYIIIGSATGGIVLIVALMIIILSVCVCYRKRRSMRGRSANLPNGKGVLRPMVSNPIYDAGPVYEVIPPNGTLRLHSNSESSNATGTSSVPPTPTSLLPPVPLPAVPIESPYAYTPNQVDPSYANPHQFQNGNLFFDYMVMNAVRDVSGKRLSDEETNLDSDSTRARYVPEPCASMV